MSDEIDLWGDLEDTERMFGKDSKEYKQEVKNLLEKYPDLAL